MRGKLRYLVLGSGRMGEAAGHDLLRQPDTERVTFADANAGRLAALRRRFPTTRAAFVRCDAGDAEKLFPLMKRHHAVASAVPYFLNLGLTRLAIGARAHFCDLGGNDTIVRRQLSLDRAAASRSSRTAASPRGWRTSSRPPRSSRWKRSIRSGSASAGFP